MVAGALHPGKPVANLYVRITTDSLMVRHAYLCPQLSVLHVVSWCCRYVNSPCWGLEIRTILYAPFSHLSSDVINQLSVKIPPRVMVVTQVWGTILGCFVNYAVMTPIVTNQREILLNPVGTNVWSEFLIPFLICDCLFIRYIRWTISTITQYSCDHLVFS